MAKLNEAMSDLLRYNSAMLPRKRSSFNKSHSHTTTLDSAALVPIFWDRVLPGDEKKIRYSGLARMATPLHPVMDEAYLDVWCFYVPDRLWWVHAKEFYGENKDASFNPDGEYIMPYLTPEQYGVNPDGYTSQTGMYSLNDYFGFPVNPSDGGDSNISRYATAGLHRSYQLIWNEWFRNSSIQPALRLNDGDNVTNAEWNVIREIRYANKFPDYFTTLLREPQAGDDVHLPLGDWAPVVTRSEDAAVTGHGPLDGDYYDFRMSPTTSAIPTFSSNNMVYGGFQDYGGTVFGRELTNGSYYEISSDPLTYMPQNLWANLTNASGATINNLRAAITVQQFLEVSNLAGKRYQQILQAHFGVFTPDATLQRPELLGASRTPVGMRQVLQTSDSSDTSPLGTTGAFSLTNVSNEWICNKAFTEPGFIMAIACVRPVISYSQGLDPLLTKLERYEHYWPVFDNLGNQPVYNYNIYAKSTNDKVFGFSEAWTEYRVKQNRVSGLMRPDVPGTLASWNYSLNFESEPYLDSEFISLHPDLIDRTIAVPSEPQFILDNYFDYVDIKNMSVHSVPGLTRL